MTNYSVHITKKIIWLTNSDIWSLTITTSACQPEHLMQPAMARWFQHPWDLLGSISQMLVAFRGQKSSKIQNMFMKPIDNSKIVKKYDMFLPPGDFLWPRHLSFEPHCPRAPPNPPFSTVSTVLWDGFSSSPNWRQVEDCCGSWWKSCSMYGGSPKKNYLSAVNIWAFMNIYEHTSHWSWRLGDANMASGFFLCVDIHSP